MTSIKLQKTAPKNKPEVEDTRTRILDATASLIRQKGFKATTVRDIGEAVGLYSGSLFHYFRTKHDILMEILRTAFITVCERHETTLASSLSPQDKLRQFIYNEIRLVFIEDQGDYHAVLYFDWRDAAPGHLPELIQLRKRYFRSWTELIRQCHEGGHLRGDPKISVRVLEGTLRGMMSWYRPTGMYSPEEMADQVLIVVARP